MKILHHQSQNAHNNELKSRTDCRRTFGQWLPRRLQRLGASRSGRLHRPPETFGETNLLFKNGTNFNCMYDAGNGCPYLIHYTCNDPSAKTSLRDSITRLPFSSSTEWSQPTASTIPAIRTLSSDNGLASPCLGQDTLICYWAVSTPGAVDVPFQPW